MESEEKRHMVSEVTFDSKEQKIRDMKEGEKRKEKKERKKNKKHLSLCKEGGDCGIIMKTRNCKRAWMEPS